MWRFVVVFCICSSVSVSAQAVGTKIENYTVEIRSEEEQKIVQYVHDLAHKASLDQSENATHQLAKPIPEFDVSMLGKEGVNYFMNGTVPYMTCAYYNTSDCNPAVRDDCPTSVNCYLEGSHRILACLGVYTWKADVTKVGTTDKMLKVPKKHSVILGCFNFMGDVEQKFCDESVCNSQRTSKIGYGFCCCHTKECNNFDNIYAPNPHYIEPQVMVAQQQEKNEPDHYTESVVWTTACIVAGCLLLTIICVIVIVGVRLIRRKQNNKDVEMQAVSGETDESASMLIDDVNNNGSRGDEGGAVEPAVEDVAPEKPAFIIDALERIQLISQGRYGHVYKGIWHKDDGSEMIVAVKKHNFSEKQSYLSEKGIYEGFLEIPMWYPAILKYLGAQQVDKEFWIITEFHERLSLYDYIKMNELSVSGALRICLTMVDGLQFLHDERPFYVGHIKPIIIHRDLKSKNILIRRDMTACIADFGLARKFEFGIFKKNNDFLGQVGTKRYMSPEVLEGATEFTPQAFKQMDVYAMALVMWEVMSRTKVSETDEVPPYMMPYQDVVGENPQIGPMRAMVVSRKYRPAFRQAICTAPRTTGVRQIIEEMWDPEADGRITAGCAFQRIWKVAYDGREDSEGYHSKPYLVSEPRMLHDLMMAYHQDPSICHPSPDPFKDTPPPAEIPEEGHVAAFNSDCVPDEKPEFFYQKIGNRLVKKRKEEFVFDLKLGRAVNPDEVPLQQEEKSGTATPDISMTSTSYLH